MKNKFDIRKYFVEKEDRKSNIGWYFCMSLKR